MSALSEALAAAKASQDAFNAALTDLENRVSTDIPGLKAQNDVLTQQVAALQAQIDAGNNDPALVNAVKDLQNQIDANIQRLANVDPAVVSAPNPNPDVNPTPTPTTTPDVTPTPTPTDVVPPTP